MIFTSLHLQIQTRFFTACGDRVTSCFVNFSYIRKLKKDMYLIGVFYFFSRV